MSRIGGTSAKRNGLLANVGVFVTGLLIAGVATYGLQPSATPHPQVTPEIDHQIVERAKGFEEARSRRSGVGSGPASVALGELRELPQGEIRPLNVSAQSSDKKLVLEELEILVGSIAAEKFGGDVDKALVFLTRCLQLGGDAFSVRAIAGEAVRSPRTLSAVITSLRDQGADWVEFSVCCLDHLAFVDPRAGHQLINTLKSEKLADGPTASSLMISFVDSAVEEMSKADDVSTILSELGLEDAGLEGTDSLQDAYLRHLSKNNVGALCHLLRSGTYSPAAVSSALVSLATFSPSVAAEELPKLPIDAKARIAAESTLLKVWSKTEPEASFRAVMSNRTQWLSPEPLKPIFDSWCKIDVTQACNAIVSIPAGANKDCAILCLIRAYPTASETPQWTSQISDATAREEAAKIISRKGE